jgi:alkylation response protein AidB-like acyl-CoA dehydrogenase
MRNDDLLTKLLRGLDALTPVVRDQAAETDRRFTLTGDVIAALHRLELFRLWIPGRDNGFELPLPASLEVYEAAARIDGSVGWTLMIGAGGGLFGAYLPEDVAADVFSSADALIAGSGAPQGRAEKIANGYLVSGRWRYASGALHATAFTANCVVTRHIGDSSVGERRRLP